jgi:DNA topoisomerase-1
MIFKGSMAGNLLIVESPAKAKTIEKILGGDFVVKSCYGHIRDLPKNKLGLDVTKGFKPDYEVSDDKKQLVSELKKSSKGTEVWLATDEDREGEAISWHLCEVLGLNPALTKRIVFNEITEPAIKKAVEKPRRLDLNLVNAQQARRVLDRLVGFELSPVLWSKLGNRKLSAGRVQSVAVRLVVEREREINAFKSAFQYRVVAIFKADGKSFKAELSKKFDTEALAAAFLNDCIPALYNVADIQVKPATKSPAAPFTTSTLQQEASRKLGYNVSRTMQIAQKLYESGKITYMRTDSTSLSETAMESTAAYILKTFGKEFSNPTQYLTKNSSAQEAHEAIRPTYIDNSEVEGTREEQKLYDLIWKRTVASQMSKALLEKTQVKIDVSTRNEQFLAEGEVIRFEGFLKVYLESTDDEEDEDNASMLPPLKKDQELNFISMEARQRYALPPARYTEASLVKKLEELGIGRPSTYAPTISTIQKREYIKREVREGTKRDIILLSLKAAQKEVQKTITDESTGSLKGKLVPTDIGLLVNDYLTEHFKRVMDYGFTADIEKEFDRIAEGDTDWVKMMDQFYEPFHKEVETSIAIKERVTGERALGIDPASGQPVIARLGRYGPMVQIGTAEDEEKPRFAKLQDGQSIETISLDDALELFKLPRVVGEFEGAVIKTNIGRFGPYLQHASVFVSLPKEDSPYTVTQERAIELIEKKRVDAAMKSMHVFSDGIEVLRGRFGPYIKKGKENYKIPKGMDPETITEEQCLQIIADSGEPKKTAAKSSTKPAAKTASKATGAAKKTTKASTKK